MMAKENNPVEDPCDVEFVCGDPKKDVRVGDEYQVEIPPMMSESERVAFLLNPLDSDSPCSFCVGLPVEVMWIDTKCRNGHGLGDDTVDMNESLKSLKAKRRNRGESDGNMGSKQLVPGRKSSSWEDLEVDGFVLGLYTFGKNFPQVQKLLESKETGELLLFYYGKFYKSAKYKMWSTSLKKPSRRCIQGKKLYSGWRLQLLLSRLIQNITDESKKQKLVDVSKTFAEGKTSLEEYVSLVKELVGLRSLVDAVAIGKDKEDLTVLTTEPINAKQWFKVSSAVPAGIGAYNALSVDDIIEKLTGGARLSKARCNEIFWDAVWPRLLDRGWHSEEPRDRGYIKSKDHYVFLVPGVEKFSRRDLVKYDHYYDSISDILKKVVAEPELLETETPQIRALDEIIEKNSCNQSKQDKHCYLRSPNSSSTHMKFTVVDTTRLASGGKLCEFREVRIPNLESEASQTKACQGDNNSVARRQMISLDIQKRAELDERNWERRRMMKLVDDPMRFMIVDASADQGGHSSGIRRWRHLPDIENPRKIRKRISKEALGESSQKQSGSNKGVNYEYSKGTDPGIKETSENVQQGQSKIEQRLARVSESNNLHSVSSPPVPKRRRLSACVKRDIKRSGESSVLKPPALDQTTNCHPKLSVDSLNLKTQQSEETGNGTCPISETVQDLSTSGQQQETNMVCSSKEQGALHEISASEQLQEQQQDRSNLLCSELETVQQQEQPIQLPPKSPSDKNSPSNDHETTQERASSEQQVEEQNPQTNTEIPRRQSTRKRPLTTRALEALESGFFTPKDMKDTKPNPRKRQRSAKVKNSANASHKTSGQSDNSFLVREATSSKPLKDVEGSDPSFLVDKVTTTSNKPVDQVEDSKVTTEYPKKLPPILLKIPFRRS